MRARTSITCATLIVGLVLLSSSELRSSPGEYQVVVHPMNPLTHVEKKFLADIFLKRAARWPNGDTILPVDLVSDSPVRRTFVREVLRRSIPAIKNYWQQLIFSGANVPPPELESEEAVIRYVTSKPGAIGYVSEGTKTGGAKVVAIAD